MSDPAISSPLQFCLVLAAVSAIWFGLYCWDEWRKK